jgi:hypothetical protein
MNEAEQDFWDFEDYWGSYGSTPGHEEIREKLKHTCLDGRTVLLKDIEDAHLLNIVNFFHRKSKTAEHFQNEINYRQESNKWKTT